MSDPHMFLTDAKIRTLKPSDKPFKVSDSHGLYLLVKPGGSRHWYLKAGGCVPHTAAPE
ncbi:DUF4102 domain-containing protein [Escherichia coli]|nr:DUF4102 domain-containing protein [Escherichia coli]